MQTILISAKNNHKCTKEIGLLPTNRFSVTFLTHFFFFLNEKQKRKILFKLSQTYDSTINFVYFEAFFLKLPVLKIFFPLRGRMLPPRTQKLLYYLTTSIINKCFKFRNDWIKIIHIRYNCIQFSPISAVLKKSKISNRGGTIWTIGTEI